MLVWNDIEKYKNEINNTKKLDGLNENDKLSKSKTNYNKNAFHFNHHVNDYGLTLSGREAFNVPYMGF